MNEVLDQLNTVAGSFSQADLLLLASALSSFLLGVLNYLYATKYGKEIHEAVKVILSLVVPFGGVAFTDVVAHVNSPLLKGAFIYTLSQVLYYAVKGFVSVATKQQQTAVNDF